MIIYFLFQKILWAPFRLIFLLFFNFEVEFKDNLEELNSPLIIASNHSSWIDPFLVSVAFPLRLRIFPVRYACWHKHYYKLLNFIPLVLFGSFPIKKKIGLEESLKIPLNILRKGGTVGIFPEERRFHRGRHRKGRRGAAYLAVRTNIKIIPVKIEEPASISFKGFILRKYKVKIKIGSPFFLPSQEITKPEDFDQATSLIMNKIWEL